MVSRPVWSVQVVGKECLAGDIWQFRLRPGAAQLLNSPAFSFVPGQFISLHFQEGDENYRRSYSIANTPEDYARTGELELVVHCLRDGHASRYLMGATPESPLSFSGPFGQLLLPETPPQRLLLIATGSGLAAYRSMLPQLIAWQNQGVLVRVLMGAQTPELLFYQDEFAPLTEAGGAFTPCYSRMDQAPDGARLGYVQEQLADLQLDPDRDLVYLCGAPPMIDSCWQELKEQGFAIKQVKREKYTYSSH